MTEEKQMRTERPTCRECACTKVCEYFIEENGRNLDEKCPLEHWEKYFVPKQEWISVDERLPKEVEHIIVCDEDGTVGEAIFLKATTLFEWVDSEEIAFATHWMPLPEAPKKGGVEE